VLADGVALADGLVDVPAEDGVADKLVEVVAEISEGDCEEVHSGVRAVD